MSDEPDRFKIDFLILADGAEAIGGKLYMLGGAWTQLNLAQIPGPPAKPFAIAIGIRVPWNLTNRKFTFELQLTDADGQPVDDEPLTGELEQGRPPGLRPGVPQLVVLTITAAPTFPAEGRYTFNVSVDNEPLASVPFEVAQMPVLPGVQPQG